MRSIEKQAATVEEATAAALAELGISIEQADVEVLQSPRRGLFGGSRQALVRVTTSGDELVDDGPLPANAGAAAAPTGLGAVAAGTEDDGPAHDSAPLAADDGTEEDTVTETADISSATSTTRDTGVADEDLTAEQRMALLDEESELAADFVEGLLDRLDLPGDIVIEVTEDTAIVNVSEVGSGLLIGRRGATLDALQELVRSSTQRQTERRSHVRVDVEGYRARQLEKLRAKARDAIAQVRETGEPYRLEPMDAYERKMMHNLVARTGGVTSASEGTEPKRRVVILPE